MPQNTENRLNYINSERIERLLNIGYWHINLKTEELFWSDETYQIYGLSPDVYEPDFETCIECFHPDDRQKIREAFEDLVGHGKDHIMQARLLHGDGSIRIIIATCNGERDKDGNIIAAGGTVQDITEYAEEQERYERIAQSSGTAIWDWNIVTDEVHWLSNSHRSLGYNDKETAPKTGEEFFSEMVHPDYELAFKHAIDTHLKDKTELAINMQVTKADGSALWVMVRGQAKWNAQGQAVQISGSFTNIEALKQAENKLRRSNSDLEQFAAIAAHDLQQPLRTISGFLEIIAENYKNKLDEKADKYINMAIEGAQNMSALVNDLLNYARIETTDLKTRRTSLNALTHKAILPLKKIIDETEATINIGKMPEITCDAHKIQRVITNIIDNAIKYRKPDAPPEINISYTKQGTMHIISIADNGIGMEKSSQDKIFNMFERLHNKQTYSGTGIGLSICKKIIELHGGTIWVQSVPDRGSVFYFEIPE